MKNEGKTRAVTRIGLLIMALVFCLLTNTALAQEEQPKTPPETQGQGQVTEAPEAPQERPKTIGEMWERKLTPDESKEATEAAPGSPEPVPTASELNFPPSREKSPQWATEGRVGESTFFDKLIEVCWSLAIICLLVWAVGKVAQKMGLQKMALGGGSESMIEILEKKRLSPGRSVMLVRVGPKVLAIAATESGCETLTEFELEDFNKFKDSKVTRLPVDSDEAETPSEGMTTPADIARHYLSIIPGTGAKK